MIAGKIISAIAGTALIIVGRVNAGEFIAAHGLTIPHQYIVVLDYDPGNALEALRPALARAMTSQHVTAPMVWNSALKGFVMSNATEEAAAEIAKQPGVVVVEPDYVVQLDTIQTNAPLGIDIIDQRSLTTNGTYIYNYTAPAVHAYVIDSGIRTTHTEFGGRATADVNFANDNAINDPYGHGTKVASVIGGITFGVAKQVRLHSARMFDSAGQGSVSQAISALNWVNANGLRPGVLNMSMQFPPSTALDNALGTIVSNGFFVAVSAGNRATTLIEGFDDACSISPARVPEAFTVADANIYSYRGSCVDIFAPGTGIAVASSSTDTATTSATGTSFSAPHSAGAAALVLQQYPSLTPNQTSWELISRSSKNLLSESSSWHLYGSPNRWLYSLSLPYYLIPSAPSDLSREVCPSSYTAYWNGGSVNSSNTSTYYELQRSTSSNFPTVTSSYYDGGKNTGSASFSSGTPLYFRIRACNSLGCSNFKGSTHTPCR